MERRVVFFLVRERANGNSAEVSSGLSATDRTRIAEGVAFSYLTPSGVRFQASLTVEALGPSEIQLRDALETMLVLDLEGQNFEAIVAALADALMARLGATRLKLEASSPAEHVASQRVVAVRTRPSQ
jgi:hypothetical protein